MDAQERRGLSTSEARSLLEREGPNALPAAPPRRLHQRVLAQLGGGLSLLLLAAALLDVGLWLIHGAR
ncbi:MAG TPA: cation-transporting P-type ATPase, partial [Polyangiaceae bacterium]|nr:cation-transporting P-type ATPase [Polyangiaceae bacterium]